jgi:hypothetical protein
MSQSASLTLSKVSGLNTAVTNFINFSLKL